MDRCTSKRDPAWQLYDEAFRLLSANDEDGAQARLVDLQKRYPDHPAATQAALRQAHLKYHLATMDVLTPAQIERYGVLRGYAGEAGGHQPGGRAKH